MYQQTRMWVASFFVFLVCITTNATAITVGLCLDGNLNGSHLTMQDASVAVPYGDNKWVFGVYDGHGACGNAGAVCSLTVARDIAKYVPEFDLDAEGVAERYRVLDEHLGAYHFGVNGGTTAITVLFDGKKLDVIHAGDCRLLVGGDKSCTALTTDHNLLNEEELARVIRADELCKSFPKGKLSWENMRSFAEGIGLIDCGDWRADMSCPPRLKINGRGGLNVVRTLGDRRYRNPLLVTPEPEQATYILSENDRFMVLVSDGITEVMRDDSIGVMMNFFLSQERDHKGNLAQEVARKLVAHAKICGSRDNLTALVVLFKDEVRETPVTESSVSPTSTTSNESKEGGAAAGAGAGASPKLVAPIPTKPSPSEGTNWAARIKGDS